MLEKLTYPRVFLYHKEVENNVLSWKLMRRFNKYPEELECDSGFLRVMSPSF
jgi:hypothetical protein